MDPISLEALTSLSGTLTGMLPPAPDPALAASLDVLPLRINPLGIGGYVGPSHVPEGEILGRRIEASVRIAVRAAETAGLGPATAAVTRAFLAADPTDLRGHGILRLSVGTVGTVAQDQAAGGPAVREIELVVLFEFLKRPAEGGGVIAEIPINLKTTERL